MYKNKEFGQFVRSLRENSHLSRERLAEFCDVSDRCIYNIEHGFSEPKLSTALAICYFCSINVGSLAEFYYAEEPYTFFIMTS